MIIKEDIKMKTTYEEKKIETSFIDYEQTQVRHLDMMNSDALPDLELMTRERDASFLVLKQALDGYMKTAGTQKNGILILTRYENRLVSMMALDEKIAMAIEKHRDLLKINLNRMKKGMTAMSGYKKAGISKPGTPCVVSMNR